ncbi:MAG: pantoate--beta-alanine ligase [Actinomycetota bacterium]
MRIVTDRHEFQRELIRERVAGKAIGFVPTMGFLHEGHASLMRRAKDECDLVAASIFVNPLQFGANEDLDRYPKDRERDTRTCLEAGVDLVLWPDSPEGMLGSGSDFNIQVGPIGDRLCGRTRPGHFDGVATIVAKLFNLAGPCRAYFGQKDAQQLVIIRRLAQAFDFPVEVIACPTVRESDGLAMSSRNSYLSSDERRSALCLSRALAAGLAAIEAGETDGGRVADAMAEQVRLEPLARLDYAACVDPESLDDLSTISGEALLAVAAFVGPARLIDNLTVTR